MQSFAIKNKLRTIQPRYCGTGHKTLIIASVGSSAPKDKLASEIDKAKVAQSVGADVVTDHSFYGDIPEYHHALVSELDILISTVGCYELASRYSGQTFQGVASQIAIDILSEQAKRGIDMITVHASFIKEHLPLLSKSKRLIPMTSKGGGIISAFMRSSGNENPYYEHFDQVLDIFAEYDVTLSLGTSFRPATVCDHWDNLLAVELECMGNLVKRAIEKKVRVMVEGVGHAAIDEIPFHVKTAKMLCSEVPYRVLPMSTDTALGFDHISGAIAGAVAVAAGADAITCMTRAEHIGLPNLEDLKEAVIATRIAAHSGELVKLRDFSKDHQMSKTRWQQGCKGDWATAIYPEGAREALKVRNRLNDQLIQCSMCGAFCGIAAGIRSAKSTKK